MSVEIREPILVHVDQLHPNSWNPNEMSDVKFNQLVSKIQEEGFGDPLKVVEVPKEQWGTEWSTAFDKHYRIWGGEHRWRAARVLGMEKIPVFADAELSEREQQLRTVRDNLVRGDLNHVKFTKLVKELDEGLDVDPSLLGFGDRDEMMKYIVREKDKKDKSFLDDFMQAAGQQREAVESLSDIVTNIFSQTAASVDQSYLLFTFKGQVHCVVLCNPTCFTEVRKMTDYLHATGRNVNDFMQEAIARQVALSSAEVQSVGEA